VRACAGKERQQLAVLAFDVAQVVAPEAGDLGLGQVAAAQKVLRREEGADRARSFRRATRRPWCAR